MQEMDLLGVRVEMPANAPMVLLRERSGGRTVPIFIGAPEATAIAMAIIRSAPADSQICPLLSPGASPPAHQHQSEAGRGRDDGAIRRRG